MKRKIALLLSIIMLLGQTTVIFAADDNLTGTYEVVENVDDDMPLGDGVDIAPQTLYLANVYTSIVKVSSTQVSIRAQAVCAEKVKALKVIYILQQWNGSQWVDIVSRTATEYDVSTAHKSYTISGLGSGTYRCKASAMATGYSGYSETLYGFSASIKL